MKIDLFEARSIQQSLRSARGRPRRLVELVFGASLLLALLAHSSSPARAATLTVTSGNDSGAGTLRQVILNASPGDTIDFAAGITTINVVSGELLINKDLTISGPGANLLTAGGTGSHRIFNIPFASASVTATISGLKITDGSAGNNSGGGISNYGTLTIINCTISGNKAVSFNNSVYGGGIFNGGLMTIAKSTISGNSSDYYGGGIANFGRLTITNSTISGNATHLMSTNGGGPAFSGGGIYDSTGGTTITNSTIFDNTGGGILNRSTATVTARNTISALNTPADVGSVTSQGFNLIGGGTLISAQSSDQIGVTATQLNLGPLQDNGGPTFTHALLSGSFAIDKGHSSGSPADQRGYVRPVGTANVSGGDGSDIGAFEVQASTPTPTATPSPTSSPTPTPTATPNPTPTPGTTPTNSFGKLLNISTRLRVLGGDNVLIGGFIVTGSEPKKVIIRGIGPSLADFGLQGALADPTLELHDGTGNLIFSNDNWKDTQKQQILDTTIPPANDLESAIVATLAPGAYTAIVRGKNNGTGVAVVEAYDLNQAADSKLANISTRGFVDTDNNVMIGGLIVGPTGTTGSTLLLRALGPSLSNFGIQNPLADPTLELHNGNGTAIASNDNWKDTQQANIQFAGIPPSNDLESAIVQTLPPGAYTAIVSGKNNGSGVGLIEVYDLTPKLLEQISQIISASQGGVITLSNGSSVSIPAGLLATDQRVTFSLLSSLPKQPPNGFIVGVGPALSILFAPVTTSATGRRSELRPNSPSNTSSGALITVLNVLGDTSTGLDGAAPIGAYTLPQVNGSVDNWWGPAGQIDPVNKKATFIIDPAVFSNAYASSIISNFGFTLGQGNINPSLADQVLPWGRKYWDARISSWLPFPIIGLPPNWDPNARTLGVEHGMSSSIEGAFGKCPCPVPGCDGGYALDKIMMAGGYAQAIGLDYPWGQHLDVSGQELADFISQSGLKNVDLEGHSEGAAVVVSAASKITDQTIQINHIVPLGGAVMGTPLANSAPGLVTFLLASPAAFFVQPLVLASGKLPTLVDLITAPVIQELQPNSPVLQQIMHDYNSNLARNGTIILPVAGTAPIVGTEILKFLFAGSFDGIIGSSPALLQGSPLKNVQAVGSYPVNHVELECNLQIIHDVGVAVGAATLTPTPTPSPTATPATALLTGKWVGMWTWSATASNGCTINDGGSFSMTLTQTGSSFSGSTTGAGVNGYDDKCQAFPATGEGTASGTISGTTVSNVSFNLCLSGCIGFTQTGTATLDNNTLTVSLVGDSSGGNSPGTGSFTVTRQ